MHNLLLAARALGLGGCLTTSHTRYEAEIKALLGIPDHVDTFALIPLGYLATPPGAVRRGPVEEVLCAKHWC